MDAILWFIIAVLLVILGWLWLKFGVINIDPQFIAICRNVWNGKLKELKPGLRFFIPGLYEIFRMVDCRQVIIDPPALTVTSRDGQQIDVDYQITLWVNGFKDKAKLKEGRAIKAATKIGEQGEAQGKDSQGRFKKDVETIGLKESNVAIQNMIAGHLLSELIGNKDIPNIICPNCNSAITKDHIFCPNDSCSKSELGSKEKVAAEKDINIAEVKPSDLDKFKIPTGFFERLSWAAGITLNNFLEEKYGLGCYLKVRNVRYPKDTERAARATKIAEMEGDATVARLAKETTAFANLINVTKVNPDVAFLGGKLLESAMEIAAGWGGGKRKSGQIEKGDSK